MTRRSLLAGLSLVLGFVGIAVVALAPAAAVAEDPTIVVLGASSLTETLQKAAAAWTAKGNPRVILSFDASSRLAKQIEAGAPADAFFSADTAWMDYLADKGLLDTATRVNLLGNTLVAVVPASSTIRVAGASDLARPEVGHLALGGENVPVGKYARAGLVSLDVWDKVKDRVTNGDNVRTVLGWVAGGEAEAGIVYATDARVEPKVRVAFTFPANSHPPIVYPAAVTKASTHARDATSFLAYCKSTEGMAVFTAAGFSAG